MLKSNFSFTKNICFVKLLPNHKINLMNYLKITKKLCVITFLVLIQYGGVKAQTIPIFDFSFDELREDRKVVDMVRGETYVPKEVFAYTKESVSGTDKEIFGKYYKLVDGVVGNAVLLDGYTAFVEFEEEESDYEKTSNYYQRPVRESFTIESWIALGAYPKNTVPIFSHRRNIDEGETEGCSLEIDSWGRVGLFIGTKTGKTEYLFSENTLPLNNWIHVAGTYSNKTGLSVYVNGKLIKSKKISGDYNHVISYEKTPYLIGKTRQPMRPTGTIRPNGTGKTNIFFDGILDELKVSKGVKTAKQIAAYYNKYKTNKKPELPVRKLPSGPQSPGAFRAVNTTLDYYPGWDAPWAVGDNADIVVQFDESDCKFVFWRGTSYIPSWVTENGIAFNNGFNEGWNDHGSCEPMSDKKTKYSSVKIIESNKARVVIQWRYALVDVHGIFAFEDPETGWGDWTNETYTIYPDMSAVRKDKLLSNAPNAAHEWQESMMVMSPGQKPEDVLDYAALTVSNAQGKQKTFSWEFDTPPTWPKDPPNINAQIVNTKSTYKPFSSVRHQDKPKMDIYAGERRRHISVFPWWNHWPVAPRPTDGRFASFPDRASHSSVSHWFWEAYEKTDRSMTKIMLCGMTNKDIDYVYKMNKGWANPAEIAVIGAKDVEYKADEKAYHLDAANSNEVEITLSGSKDTPILNPAFVIKNWGEYEVEISINSVATPASKNLRYDFRDSLNAVDLIVWARTESTAKTTIKIAKKK